MPDHTSNSTRRPQSTRLSYVRVPAGSIKVPGAESARKAREAREQGR